MRRALPFLLFAAVTVTVFWRFLLFGESLYAVKTVGSQLGQAGAAARAPDEPHDPNADNILLLPLNLRIYNEGLKAGELRLWNPYLFCGYPIFADPMVQPFYPPHLILHAIFRPDAAFEISLLLHLFFSGVVMFLALRALGRSAAASTAGGLVWMLFGYNAIYFSSSVLLGTSVFGPLALLGIHRGLATRSLRLAAAAGGSMGLAVLGSHPQYALHLFLFLTLWLAVSALRDRAYRGFVVRYLGIFILFTVGVGLVAILTRLDTLANGYRQPAFDLRYFYAKPWTLLLHLADLVVGKAFINPDPIIALQFPAYAGLGATALAIAAAVRRRAESWVRFVAVAAIATLAAAFVEPVATLLSFVPILNMSPSARWIFTFGFCLSILAAYGLDALAEDVGRAPAILSAALAGFLVLCLGRVGPFRATSRASIGTMVGFGLLAAAGFAARAKPRAAFALCLGGLLVELLPYFLAYNAHADASALRKTPEPIEFVRAREGKRPWRGTGGLGSAAARAGRVNYIEVSYGNNILATHDVENPAGYEAILPAHYVTLCRIAGEPVDPTGRAVLVTGFESPILELMGLKYVFMPYALRVDEPYRLVRSWGSLRLYENPRAMPRAFFPPRILQVPDAGAAVNAMIRGGFDPHSTAVIETSRPEPLGGANVEGRVSWAERLPDRLRLEVEAPAPAVLVLTETDYPGWEARVDGRETTIYRADVAFRAIEIPAGTHSVEFRFRPESVRLGIPGSLLSLAMAAAFCFRRRAATSSGAPPGSPAS